jgi:hypothetical protein
VRLRSGSLGFLTKKRTSGAKALISTALYATAEAVPFVGRLLQKLFGSAKTSCAVQIGQLKNLFWTGLALRDSISSRSHAGA